MFFGTFVQSAEYAQGFVQDKFALTNLHLLVHPFLQLHSGRALQTLEISRRIVHSGFQLSSLHSSRSVMARAGPSGCLDCLSTLLPNTRTP